MQQTIRITDQNTLEIRISTGAAYTVREPLARDMEGLGQDLIKIKHTDTVQKVIHRISSPQITRLQYIKLSLSDAQVLNTALDFFSAPPSAKAEIQEALAELGYRQECATTPTDSPQS